MEYNTTVNNNLIYTLLTEQKHQIRNGIYGYTQRELAYNSNKIEGSTLTKEHTASLFETGSIYTDTDEVYKAKDIEEMQGHFAMFNAMLNTLSEPLNEQVMKLFHKQLKQCVFEDIANGYNIGEYKARRNYVGDIDTATPDEVEQMMQELLSWYHNADKNLETLALFHARYEKIHPFQDGNGRTGRLILFRECLKYAICPFVLQDEDRPVYLSAIRKAQTIEDMTSLVALMKKGQIRYLEKLDGCLMEAPKEG
ncbi:MAG: Fic family protein [Lachnospiraceae bacterium]|nr:Fic family protein [Lachnospiraceae bacterium]